MDEDRPGRRDRPAHWLRPAVGATTPDGHPPQAYLAALRHVIIALDTDPDWRRWWSASGVPACELTVFADGYLDRLGPSADVRKDRGGVRAAFTCAVPAYDGTDPAVLVAPAVAELTGMLEVIREAVGLSLLPPVPPLAGLPPGVLDGEVASVDPPPVPAEPAAHGRPHGCITLAQIQRFLGDSR
jgi:hypothetical protein